MKHFHVWIKVFGGTGWNSGVIGYRCASCGKVKPK